MATIGAALIESMVADVDLTAYQYHGLVTASTANKVGIASGASGRAPEYILLNSPSAGQAAEVLVYGRGKMAVNGGTAIGVGDFLITDASAKGIGTTGASIFCATALQAVASGCAIIDIFWRPGSYYIADNTP